MKEIDYYHIRMALVCPLYLISDRDNKSQNRISAFLWCLCINIEWSETLIIELITSVHLKEKGLEIDLSFDVLHSPDFFSGRWRSREKRELFTYDFAILDFRSRRLFGVKA